jgi:hypothetical protein
MTILELISAALRENGYGGLYLDGVCGCQVGDLSPGSCLCDDCRPGYLHVHFGTGDWIIAKEKSLTDSQIADIVRGAE